MLEPEGWKGVIALQILRAVAARRVFRRGALKKRRERFRGLDGADKSAVISELVVDMSCSHPPSLLGVCWRPTWQRRASTWTRGISEFYWVRGYLIVIREVKRIVTWSVRPSAKLMPKSSGVFLNYACFSIWDSAVPNLGAASCPLCCLSRDIREQGTQSATHN